MDTIYDKYKVWANATEESILGWMDNDMSYKLSSSRNFPLSSLSDALFISWMYLLIVLAGSIFMKKMNIPVINVKMIQFIYNPIQIILCSYMCVEASIQAYRNKYTILPPNKFNEELPIMGNILWLFYISKILDFCDTLFIIARKKWNQLSFLHVYHHLTIYLVYWLNLRAGYDGDIYLTIVLNGFVHAIMYTYYFISQHTKNIWWKKYLTVIQMIQFLIMNIQGYYLIMYPSGFPYRLAISYVVYVQTLFWLFFNFYISTYCLKKKDQTKIN